MKSSTVQPIQAIGDAYREEKQLSSRSVRKPANSKVTGIVLPKISSSEGQAALFPSATAPRIVIPASSVTESEEDPQSEYQPKRRSKRVRLRREIGKEIPIGLKREDPLWSNMMNALMQFLIYLPGFVDLFYYAPRSFHPFLEFNEQYLHDQEDNHPISRASSMPLVRCLMKNVPHLRSPYQSDLFEVLISFAKALHIPKGDSVIFHSDRQIIWSADTDETLEEVFRKKSEGKLSELLVAIKGMDPESCRLVNKQLFRSDRVCFDLHAFIECRPDRTKDACYLTYLKIDGRWYQCYDERISELRSNSLQIPLSKSILLYYKRVEFEKPYRN